MPYLSGSHIWLTLDILVSSCSKGLFSRKLRCVFHGAQSDPDIVLTHCEAVMFDSLFGSRYGQIVCDVGRGERSFGRL